MIPKSQILRSKLLAWIILPAALLFTLCSPKETFTKGEEAIILKEYKDNIMPLYTTTDPAELKLLRLEAKPLSPDDLKSDLYPILKEKMLATVNNPDNLGVGIAAPQVGISKRLIAVQRLDQEEEPFMFYPNCEIIEYSEKTKYGWEGCLSIPDIRDTVSRSVSIIIRYLNEDSLKIVEEKIEGFTAVIFQHEVDHLDGRLFTDLTTPHHQ